MIYATGDTHGNFQRFAPEHFPEQAGMTKEDYMIICGDFGGVWDGGKKEERNLDWLEDRPFTTLFISGNHENFDLLRKYPTEEWNGGKIQRIRPHVILSLIHILLTAWWRLRPSSSSPTAPLSARVNIAETWAAF